MVRGEVSSPPRRCDSRGCLSSGQLRPLGGGSISRASKLLVQKLWVVPGKGAHRHATLCTSSKTCHSANPRSSGLHSLPPSRFPPPPWSTKSSSTACPPCAASPAASGSAAAAGPPLGTSFGARDDGRFSGASGPEGILPVHPLPRRVPPTHDLLVALQDVPSGRDRRIKPRVAPEDSVLSLPASPTVLEIGPAGSTNDHERQVRGSFPLSQRGRTRFYPGALSFAEGGRTCA